ncbi:MAG: CHAP domain-containing protein [Clostridia bacterium]|nr:CHAP domain-containing protein [Clostridia bacterium]
MTDREKFLTQARTYIGRDGNYVCKTQLKLGAVYDWCAFVATLIMQDCGFIGKYIKSICGGAGDIPRYSDGKYGTWFAKGTKAPQAGDLFFLRYADYPSRDKYFCDHVGIVESVSGNTITTLEGNVDGYGSNWAATSTFKRKTRYLSDSNVYAFYRPDWEGEDSKTTTKTDTTNIDVTYQVHTVGGGWLPNVKNLEDYAGLENRPIDGIYANTSKGHIRYRVKLIGSKNYLPWVTDREDYAGILGKQIDCVQMELSGVDGYTVAVEYRVSTAKSTGYLDWVQGYNNDNEDGYAGLVGVAIDKLEIRIVKK